MTAEEQRIIGRLEAGVGNLEYAVARLEKNSRDDFGKVFARLDLMASEGCAVGRQNSLAIEELKRRPERVVGLLAAGTAILGAVAAWWRN